MQIAILPEISAIFVLVFARVGTLVMLMPGIGERFIFSRARLSLAFFIALMIVPIARPSLRVPGDVSGVVTLLIGELLIGLVIGFYDGFFGPGTGSFFVFLFVRLLGYDFLNASASAKLLNCATNIAAIALFAAKGHVWWHFAVTLAVANVLGSLLGTHMALKHGTGFVRGIFIVVVSTLILKTGYDAFLR